MENIDPVIRDIFDLRQNLARASHNTRFLLLRYKDNADLIAIEELLAKIDARLADKRCLDSLVASKGGAM